MPPEAATRSHILMMPQKKQVKYYPEEYRDCIGKSYNDYIETKQMNIFELMEEYTGKSYSDLPEQSDGIEVPEDQKCSAEVVNRSESEGEERTVVSMDDTGGGIIGE